jgi:hypothetical protein
VLRAVFALALLALGVVWIEARWSARERALRLRLRAPEEIRALVEAGSRDLARRAAIAALRAWQESEREPAAVGAAAPPPPERGAKPPERSGSSVRSAAPPESHTREELDRLDALVREATRE